MIDVYASAGMFSDKQPIGGLTADERSRVLADGTVMPLLGLGVWQIPDGPDCVHAVRAC